MNQQVRELFKNWGSDEKGLVETLDALALSQGEEVYSEIFRFLTGRDFEASTASRYWREALVRWESAASLRPAQQRVRGALFDYLHQVVGDKFDSVSDGLTGLYTRAFGRHHLEKLLAQSHLQKFRQPLALIFLDIDGFREYNEHCGSPAGDRALRQLADLLRQQVRDVDVAVRYGGGTFSLILPDRNRVQASAAAEKIRSDVARMTFSGPHPSTSRTLTVSCGVATFPQDGDTVAKLCREAERQLNQAKRARNTVQPARTERRKSQRKPICSLIEFAAGGKDAFAPALATDISHGGIAFGCDMVLAPGTPLHLRFRQPYWPQTREVTGTVRQVRREGLQGVTHIGLEFALADNAPVPLPPGRCPSAAPAGGAGPFA